MNEEGPLGKVLPCVLKLTSCGCNSISEVVDVSGQVLDSVCGLLQNLFGEEVSKLELEKGRESGVRLNIPSQLAMMA